MPAPRIRTGLEFEGSIIRAYRTLEGLRGQ